MTAARPTRSFVRPVLLPLAIAALAATSACQRDAAPPAEVATDAAPVAQFDARLNLVNNNGQVRFDGTVDSTTTRDAIVAALTRAYGTERVSGHVAVDRGARPAPWQAALPQFLAAFTQPGAAVSFEGRRIELSGHASDADRKALLARAELLYPGYAYAGLFKGIGDDAGDGADAVLANVKPGTSGNALVDALNEAVAETPIRFEPGSARVSPDSLALLSKAAQVIQAAGTQTRLEVAGPTGEDPSLSQQRAEAIKVQLIINGVNPALIETARQAVNGDAARFRLLP
ncbi:OmpA family protein [Lysobacter panacisoli]|uniref:OmpA-like domain-containing protein n=1 Tax=Lysobacter panacisoli TaxID=1255263 RepID=A0ABP9LDN4_9GAMM|nr:OmpA family protein [Lysobacter panacisoli]